MAVAMPRRIRLNRSSLLRRFMRNYAPTPGEELLKAEMVGVVANHEKKVKKKRLLTIAVSVLTVILIFTCINLWPASIDYGSSEIYSREDMNDAIALIKDKFYSWEGCKLYSIYYTDDGFCQRELTSYLLLLER